MIAATSTQSAMITTTTEPTEKKVAQPAESPCSSIHRDIRQGRVDAEWTATDQAGDFGE